MESQAVIPPLLRVGWPSGHAEFLILVLALGLLVLLVQLIKSLQPLLYPAEPSAGNGAPLPVRAPLPLEQQQIEAGLSIKMQLLSHLSHEIRTPLGGVLGYAEQLLVEGTLVEPQREQLVALRRCAYQLNRVINDIQELASLQESSSDLPIQSCCLPQLLHEVSSRTQLRNSDRKVSLHIFFRTPIPEVICTDPLRLRHLLACMLDCAIRSAAEDVIDLELEARASGSDQSEILIFTLIMGETRMSADEQSRQNLDSWSFDQTMFRKASGLGLELSISKDLARQLGGDLDLVESTSNQKSRLKCHIKAKPEEGTRLVEEFSNTSSFRDSAADIKTFIGKLKDVRILLVEDGEDNQRIFSYFLRLAGATVLIEQDGQRALQLIAKDDLIDLILMDIQLPGMNGYVVTAELRKMGFEKPIIAVSAQSPGEEVGLSGVKGFNAYLAKPVEIDRLIRTVMAQLQLSDSTAELKRGGSVALAVAGGAVLSKYHHVPVYRQMIKEFVNGLEGRLSEAASGIREQRWHDVARVMHQLKGAAATYGYAELSTLAGRLENQTVHTSPEPKDSVQLSQAFTGLIDLGERMKKGLDGPSEQRQEG